MSKLIKIEFVFPNLPANAVVYKYDDYGLGFSDETIPVHLGTYALYLGEKASISGKLGREEVFYKCLYGTIVCWIPGDYLRTTAQMEYQLPKII